MQYNTLIWVVPVAAASASSILAFASMLRRRPSVATWFFCAGMLTLALDSLCTGLALRSSDGDTVGFWLTQAFRTELFVPLFWLSFSLTYSRGQYQQFLRRWRVLLAVASVLPVAVALIGPTRLVHVVAADTPSAGWAVQASTITRVLSGALVVSMVFVLSNLEHTFRAAIGTMRWRIKFVIVALVVIFGTDIYVRSQAILFSAHDAGLGSLASVGLIIGCVFLMLAYMRTGWAEIDVYPSQAVLRSSITLLLVGGYLVAVGIGAQLVKRFGGAEYFQLQAVVVLLGLSGLAVLLLSDRFRERVRAFAARHFRRAQHDSVRIWTSLSKHLATVQNKTALCAASVRVISETFEALSVTIWLTEGDSLTLGGSTSLDRSDSSPDDAQASHAEIANAVAEGPALIDLEEVQGPWAEKLRRLNGSIFPAGGHRWCVPLRAGTQVLGILVLGDRVNGTDYSIEERELLACIGDQVTSVLLNLQLADEVAQARELDAFRTMSAFFVHDLKNAAASLNLTLKNMPMHFDDPAFRADALRVVGNTARRIDDLIARLSSLRQRPDFRPVSADLNELVNEAVGRLGDLPSVELTATLQPLPKVLADREQIQSVVSNLVLNARDAVRPGGHVHLRTEHQSNRVVLSVTDDGCGMSAQFLKESLFRPFQSTKPKGLGIGLFQSRAIVQAHGGTVQVDSTPGHGTTFQVILPVMDAQ